ncbi:hypothetical protein OAH29_00195 [Akkermansiaceae bacterium]|nr:hypothetical protein [Akkermansiaceae bacterium]
MDIPDFSQSSAPPKRVEKDAPRVLNQEVAREIVSSPNDFNLSCVEELTECGAEVFAAADQSVDLYLEGELSLGLSEITVTQAKCLMDCVIFPKKFLRSCPELSHLKTVI